MSLLLIYNFSSLTFSCVKVLRKHTYSIHIKMVLYTHYINTINHQRTLQSALTRRIQWTFTDCRLKNATVMQEKKEQIVFNMVCLNDYRGCNAFIAIIKRWQVMLNVLQVISNSAHSYLAIHYIRKQQHNRCYKNG